MANDSREDSFREFFKLATNGFAPYGWQIQVAVDGLPDVLPVPTGLGKTEVALAWAWRLRRLLRLDPADPLRAGAKLAAIQRGNTWEELETAP